MGSLLDQILALKSEGRNYSEISQTLISLGHDPKLVHLALEEVAISQFQLGPKPKPKSLSISSKLVFALSSVLLVLISAPVIFIIYSQNSAHTKVTADNSPIVLNTQVLPERTVTFETKVLISTTSADLASSSAVENLDSVILKKSKYSIALFGDSMIDTMGDKLGYLSSYLKQKYPKTKFDLYNYGIGAQNVEQGLARFDEAYDNKSRHYVSISSLKPDVIILGSFAYNPFSPHDRDRHWVGLSNLIDKAKNLDSKVYVLAEIAPLANGFGVGKTGVNWPSDIANDHEKHIRELLENAIALSHEKQVGLINVYAQSLINNPNGNKAYVSPQDGIHPSEKGQSFTASIIVDTIKLD